jgi:hypothetical protein
MRYHRSFLLLKSGKMFADMMYLLVSVKPSTRFIRSVRMVVKSACYLHVRLSAHISANTTRRIFVKFYIGNFQENQPETPGHFRRKPRRVSHCWQDRCCAATQRKYCCASKVTLFIFITLLAAHMYVNNKGKALLRCHGNNVYINASQCYATRTLLHCVPRSWKCKRDL